MVPQNDLTKTMRPPQGPHGVELVFRSSNIWKLSPSASQLNALERSGTMLVHGTDNRYLQPKTSCTGIDLNVSQHPEKFQTSARLFTTL